jgi:acetyl esterase
MSCEEKKQPRLSPAYNNLESLTSAIFIVGTADGVLDDTLLMAAKWQIAGNDAMVKFIPGACHGFMTFDALKVKVTRQGLDIVIKYIHHRLTISDQ